MSNPTHDLIVELAGTMQNMNANNRLVVKELRTKLHGSKMIPTALSRMDSLDKRLTAIKEKATLLAKDEKRTAALSEGAAMSSARISPAVTARTPAKKVKKKPASKKAVKKKTTRKR